MDGRDTVSAMRADDSKVGHPNFALGAFFYKAYTLNTSLIFGKTSSDLINQATVDFVDDLQVTRQHAFKPDYRPFLKSFGQERVISGGESPFGKIPSLIPSETRFIEQNPHQLRHRHCRVRIIELNSNFVGWFLPVGVGPSEATDKIGERAGDEKILLHKTQSLSLRRVVVGIQHPGERFGLECFG